MGLCLSMLVVQLYALFYTLPFNGAFLNHGILNGLSYQMNPIGSGFFPYVKSFLSNDTI